MALKRRQKCRFELNFARKIKFQYYPDIFSASLFFRNFHSQSEIRMENVNLSI